MDRDSFGTDFKFIWHLSVSPSEGARTIARRVARRKQRSCMRATVHGWLPGYEQPPQQLIAACQPHGQGRQQAYLPPAGLPVTAPAASDSTSNWAHCRSPVHKPCPPLAHLYRRTSPPAPHTAIARAGIYTVACSPRGGRYMYYTRWPIAIDNERMRGVGLRCQWARLGWQRQELLEPPPQLDMNSRTS